MPLRLCVASLNGCMCVGPQVESLKAQSRDPNAAVSMAPDDASLLAWPGT